MRGIEIFVDNHWIFIEAEGMAEAERMYERSARFLPTRRALRTDSGHVICVDRLTPAPILDRIQTMEKINIGQIWHDKDKRSLSGNRHVRVNSLGTKASRRPGGGTEVVATCVGVYKVGDTWVDHKGRPTTISQKTLQDRFELVSQ